MRIIESRRRMLGSGSGNQVFYLQSFDGSQTLEFEFEPGMTWSDFVASEYNDGMFILDTTTQAQIAFESFWPGATITGALAYNGFAIALTKRAVGEEGGLYTDEFIWLSTEGMTSGEVPADELLIESERIYYCDGVGYVPPEATYIYKPGYTAFQNAVSSGANGSFSYSFSTSYISGRFGGALSAGHSLYIGIRMKDYSKIKIDFQNLSGGTTNIGYATSRTATTLSGQKTFSGSARTVAEIDISSVTTTSTRYLIFGGPSGNSSYRIYEISLV